MVIEYCLPRISFISYSSYVITNKTLHVVGKIEINTAIISQT